MSRRQPGHRRSAKSTRTRSASQVRALGLVTALVASTAAATGGLWWLTSRLFDAARGGGTTFDETVGVASAIGCWVCVGWFVLALTVSAVAAAPGALGRSCAATAVVLAPWTVRRLVAAALGLTVVTGPAAAAAAVPAEPSTASSATAVVQVHPRARLGTDPAAAGSQLDQRAVSARLGADLPPLDRPAGDAYVVTVGPGDCLWSIAGRHLGPQATDAEIAAAWPRWYVTNREVIGADPNLLHPGQQLMAPH